MASLAPPAGASVLSYPLSVEFSGAVPPSGAPPWLGATFDDQDSAGSLTLTLVVADLTASEFVSKWMFNLDPSLDLGALSFGALSKVGAFDDPTIDTGVDQFKADGDGKFDIRFSFSTKKSANQRFGAGESMSIEIAGIPTLTASSFDFLSAPAGGSGPFPTAAHVQGTGVDGGDSGWITVPEPTILLLLSTGTVAGVALAWRKRREHACPTCLAADGTSA